MKAGSAALQERLMEHNTDLQVTGGAFAKSLNELHQLQRTQASVAASKKVPDAVHMQEHLAWHKDKPTAWQQSDSQNVKCFAWQHHLDICLLQ